MRVWWKEGQVGVGGFFIDFLAGVGWSDVYFPCSRTCEEMWGKGEKWSWEWECLLWSLAASQFKDSQTAVVNRQDAKI